MMNLEEKLDSLLVDVEKVLESLEEKLGVCVCWECCLVVDEIDEDHLCSRCSVGKVNNGKT